MLPRGRSGNSNKGKRPTIANFKKNEFASEIEASKKYHKENAIKWSKEQDWNALFDEFRSTYKMRPSSTGPKETFIYQTIFDFANYKADGNEDVNRWMIKSIGPTPRTEIPWQNDWALIRTVDHTKEMILVKKIETQLEQDFGVMKIAAPVAASYLSFQEIPKEMKKMVDDYLGESVIQKKPAKFKDAKHRRRWYTKQETRMEFYRTWMQRILDFKSKVDQHYLNAVGFNKPNMVELFSFLLQNRKDQGVTKAVAGNALAQALFNMESEKAAMFDVPLPEDYQKAITAEATPVEDDEEEAPKKKNKVH